MWKNQVQNIMSIACTFNTHTHTCMHACMHTQTHTPQQPQHHSTVQLETKTHQPDDYNERGKGEKSSKCKLKQVSGVQYNINGTELPQRPSHC